MDIAYYSFPSFREGVAMNTRERYSFLSFLTEARLWDAWKEVNICSPFPVLAATGAFLSRPVERR